MGMRDRWIRFLQLRRQNDTVKIICLFVLTAVISLVHAGFYIWDIYQYANTPAEYVLTKAETVTEMDMDELCQSMEVTRISRQKEQTLSLRIYGKDVEITVLVMEKEYMEKRFGRESSAGTTRFYMNQNAFSAIQQEMEGAGIASGRGIEQTKELPVSYVIDEAIPSDGDGGDEGGKEGYSLTQSDKTAKCIVVENEAPEEEPYICITAKNSLFLKDADSVRVQLKAHDLDGLQTEQLKKMGYEIENEKEVIQEEFEVELSLLHIWCGLLVCGVCLVGIYGMWRR